MKIPVHSSKNRIVYGDGSYPSRWSLGKSRGWLGSGVNDKNDREIFEGDILAVDFDAADKIIGEGHLVKDLRPKKNSSTPSSSSIFISVDSISFGA